MTGPACRLEVGGGVATVTLDRPENRNALSRELVASLVEALQAAMADPDARVVVLTASGSVFCAGADLKEQREPAPREDDDRGLSPMVQAFRLILDGPKPVVGRIQGHAVAGGVGLAAACDISIAAEGALFGFTEVRIGVAPAIISVVCLPKLRTADALELFLSGERVEATRAAEVGLVNRAVPADQLDAAVDDVVGKLLLGGPTALAASKQLVRRVPAMDVDEAFTWAADTSARLFASDEAREGMTAYAERRRPSWAARGEDT